MSPDGIGAPSRSIIDDIVAIRDRWHTKHHPMFRDLADGKLDLRALGIYMAQHGHFVKFAYQAFAAMIVRASSDVQAMMIENLAEEQGLLAGPDGEAHNHPQMIFDFCEAAGLSRDEVTNIEPTPAWWARQLHYRHVCENEPVGVALAMLSTQEGQQPELNAEVTIPAFAAHYGYARDAKEIKFFVEHESADLEHAGRQLDLCAAHLQDPVLHDRARKVSEQACMLRWASTTDTYRFEALGEQDYLPPSMQ
jgi:pyrroloquinoline quinone (PQQ) biosynthesis protein C